MAQDRDFQIPDILMRYAFQTRQGRGVSPDESDAILGAVAGISIIAIEGIPQVEKALARFGKSIPPKRWAEGALIALGSLIPEGHH